MECGNYDHIQCMPTTDCPRCAREFREKVLKELASVKAVLGEVLFLLTEEKDIKSSAQQQ